MTHYEIICTQTYRNRPSVSFKVGEFFSMREAKAFLKYHCYDTPTRTYQIVKR